MSGTLDRVRDVRVRARAILRAPALDEARRTDRLVRLVRSARQEPDAELVARAILAELEWDLDRYDVEAMRAFGDPLENRHRRLRVAGYERCPECWSPLTNAVDWTRWRHLREAAIREPEAREAAVTR